MTILVDSRIVSDSETDNAVKGYLKVCFDTNTKEKLKTYNTKIPELAYFGAINLINLVVVRVDMVIKIVMVLSHGTVNVERGFSINSECLNDNLKEDTLIAQRVVYDKIQSSVGDVNNYEIPNSFVIAILEEINQIICSAS